MIWVVGFRRCGARFPDSHDLLCFPPGMRNLNHQNGLPFCPFNTAPSFFAWKILSQWAVGFFSFGEAKGMGLFPAPKP